MTDRLAYLNFVQGSLASTLATKLDASRASLKALRDAEAAILPRRNIRTSLQNQIARIEHDQQKGQDKKMAELKDQLRKAELEDAGQEREVEILKRKAARESERLKWEAIREVIFIISHGADFNLKNIVVRREACPAFASSNSYHCRAPCYSSDPGATVHWRPDDWRCSSIPPAST